MLRRDTAILLILWTCWPGFHVFCFLFFFFLVGEQGSPHPTQNLVGPPDLNKTDCMMEGPFRPQNAAYTQHHLPKLKQRPAPSKPIVLGKSLTPFLASVVLILANCSGYLGNGFVLKGSP